jgi:uncharacterized protein (DUF1330 family)
MSVYVIAQIDVFDPAEYQNYRAGFMPAISAPCAISRPWLDFSMRPC